MKYITNIVILLFFITALNAQKNQKFSPDDSIRKLREYARVKQAAYQEQEQLIDNFLKYHKIKRHIKSGRGGIQSLERIVDGRPVFQMTHNLNAAQTISTDLLWTASSSPFQLDGLGIELGIWDGGKLYDLHQEFAGQGRIWQRDTPPFLLDHSTHIAGTIGAAGINPLSTGMAGKASLLAYDFSNDMAEMALAASEGLALSNHSYGTVCGWKFNSESENWYWYGNASLNEVLDESFGLYDSSSWDIDYIAYLAPYYLMVKSAGNDRNEGPEQQPITHFDWNDGWQECNTIHNIDGAPEGYDCLGPKAVSKNNLAIGSVLDLPNGYTHPDEVQLAPYSAWGPCNDGRIKPDLVANGETVLSSVSDDAAAYAAYSGTSMAAASATGTITLLLQLQQQLSPGIALLASTIKGLLINTANECGPSPGPDYQFGWGLINAYAAATCLQNNYASGGALIKESTIQPNETQSFLINISDNQDELKVTLCWTDPPGTIQDHTQLSVSNLINDIDLSIENLSNGTSYLPWVLNPTSPSLAAGKGVNVKDNVEQVQIPTPPPGEYLIRVHATSITEGSEQTYSLIINQCMSNATIYPPKNLSYRIDDAAAQLFWEPAASSPNNYIIYKDKVPVAQTQDTTIIISGLDNGTSYNFYVKASYDNEQYSLPTNTIRVTPLQACSTPFYTDFESGIANWQIQQRIDSWRLGNKDSLTSYYLNLEENTTEFIWIDSGINKWHSHVSDIAASPPINLENHTDITVTFNYVFVTGIYDVIDELHLVYRQVGDAEWTKVMQPIASSDWREASCQLPPEAAKANVQIGFYYDDFYLHGMGAAIDDISVISTIPTSINHQTPAPQVVIYNNRVEISSSIPFSGMGNWELFDVTGRRVNSGQLEFLQGQAQMQVPYPERGLYLIRLRYNGTCNTFKILLSP
ncbi:S8 family serine peptidase [Carboxylicivirga taeanensis]|uniref:S8 family serine peptidase n=1 Tax=Carboxylicivirga taeanensis TaxID=1416875 RepID=UPI003F6E11D8